MKMLQTICRSYLDEAFFPQCSVGSSGAQLLNLVKKPQCCWVELSRCFTALDAWPKECLGADFSPWSVPQAVYSGAGLHLP